MLIRRILYSMVYEEKLRKSRFWHRKQLMLTAAGVTLYYNIRV